MKERKRILALLLSGVMALGLFGCGVTTGSKEAAQENTPAPASDAGTAAENKGTDTAGA